MKETSPRVRVIMMQKDEGDMLVRWLLHYAGLFGLENITILDNGSVEPLTLEVLDHAERLGARIHRGLDTQHDFQNKGGHFGNIIKHWDTVGGYDFALPVDCDELLAVFTNDGLTTDHATLRAELQRLTGIKRALRLDMSLFNVPGRPGWFCPDRHFHKGFLPARSIKILDNGQHAPESALEAGYSSTRLTYLHFHNRPYDELIKKTRRKLDDLLDVDDPVAVAAYGQQKNMPGSHLIKLLTMSEEDYMARYDDHVRVYVPDAGNMNLLDGPCGVHFWDHRRYLDANPDVRFYELTALHHYLLYGFLEGRPF